ncbi:DinB family protein [Flavihumibacter sp.]|uniref:DinB family protein n=1 Tax=Flavihumibacter sp. TaxID=1913981 RepID=UPI002FCC9674
MSNTIISQFISEFNTEVPATRKCLERIPEGLSDWKPHEKSMTLGYLCLLVAEIPMWITEMIKTREINFQTFKHFQPKDTTEMVNHFDENVKAVQDAFAQLAEEDLAKPFVLKNGEQILISSPLIENISSTLNHWVHHRGQLTVYMRLNNIAVPSIYGPSADEKTF